MSISYKDERLNSDDFLIEHIPLELLDKISEFCDTKDIINIRCSSKYLYNIRYIPESFTFNLLNICTLQCSICKNEIDLENMISVIFDKEPTINICKSLKSALDNGIKFMILNIDNNCYRYTSVDINFDKVYNFFIALSARCNSKVIFQCTNIYNTNTDIYNTNTDTDRISNGTIIKTDFEKCLAYKFNIWEYYISYTPNITYYDFVFTITNYLREDKVVKHLREDMIIDIDKYINDISQHDVRKFLIYMNHCFALNCGNGRGCCSISWVYDESVCPYMSDTKTVRNYMIHLFRCIYRIFESYKA